MISKEDLLHKLNNLHDFRVRLDDQFKFRDTLFSYSNGVIYKHTDFNSVKTEWLTDLISYEMYILLQHEKFNLRRDSKFCFNEKPKHVQERILSQKKYVEECIDMYKQYEGPKSSTKEFNINTNIIMGHCF